MARSSFKLEHPFGGLYKCTLGCLLVTTGVILAVVGGASNGLILFEVKFFWPAVMMISAAFQATASIIKELVFIDGAKCLEEFVFIDGAKCIEGKRPDIFVVNSFGSGF
ncbi:Protein CLT2, chloroplastic [Zea mays]|uniref:Protein CLT2, chloroplastic n=1 Tax=Zea mays TaxID=4577 RepID=A0A3L6E0L3_MAIZE|nr:Protein CLT2, chloroplastic [Zea mays]